MQSFGATGLRRDSSKPRMTMPPKNLTQEAPDFVMPALSEPAFAPLLPSMPELHENAYLRRLAEELPVSEGPDAKLQELDVKGSAKAVPMSVDGTPMTLSKQRATSADPMAAVIELSSRISTASLMCVALFLGLLALLVVGCTKPVRDVLRRSLQRLYCVDTIPFLVISLSLMWLIGSFLGGFSQIVAVCLFVVSLMIDFAFFSKCESARDLSNDAWHAERASLPFQQWRQTARDSAAPWQKYSRAAR